MDFTLHSHTKTSGKENKIYTITKHQKITFPTKLFEDNSILNKINQQIEVLKFFLRNKQC